MERVTEQYEQRVERMLQRMCEQRIFNPRVMEGRLKVDYPIDLTDTVFAFGHGRLNAEHDIERSIIGRGGCGFVYTLKFEINVEFTDARDIIESGFGGIAELVDIDPQVGGTPFDMVAEWEIENTYTCR